MAPAKAAAKPKAKKANGYARPAEVALGTVLTDIQKQSWKVGPSIGSGGFGDIYSCCSATSPAKKAEDYPHVVKIEPHSNGPLFVEMHFYARNCKKDDIEKFRISKGLKHLGMPHLISHGSQEIHGERHRFLVIPRFGTDIWKLFLQNNRRLPQHTVFRIGIQLINVLEYMHSRGYVHADIKGANILLGTGKTGAEQCFLVDFGLANHFTTKEYKPDPKNAHNGTIEYTSRDAHNGVSTMRGDMEILGLNLVHWLGLDLPWESQKLLANVKKVQEAKEQYMKSLDKNLAAAPEALKSFMKYVEKMRHDETPDYEKVRGFLEKGLKVLGKADKGPLEFDSKGAASSVASTKTPSNTPVKATPKKRVRSSSATPPVAPVESPRRRKTPVAGPARKRNVSPSPSPELYVPKETSRRKVKETPPVSVKDDSSVIILDSPLTDHGPTPESVRRTAKERRGGGKLVVNNELTPKTATTAKRAKKTYEFNFELDVSMEADVVVNVKRKKKEPKSSNGTTPTGLGRKAGPSGTGTPGTPMSPVVRKRIARNVKVTPSGTVRVEKG